MANILRKKYKYRVAIMLFKLIEVSFVSTGRDSDKPENDGDKHLAPF